MSVNETAAQATPAPEPSPHTKRSGEAASEKYLRHIRNVVIAAFAVLCVGVGAGIGIGVSNAATQSSNFRKVEQLQTDTNDNLCNQSAYQGGVTCIGGDANGGSVLP